LLQFVGCFAKFVTEKEVGLQAITEEMDSLEDHKFGQFPPT
jgi:hypothetical protein